MPLPDPVYICATQRKDERRVYRRMEKHIRAVEDSIDRAHASGWLSTDAIERASLSSEDPTHLLEDALEGKGEGWRASEPGRQTIALRFKLPQAIRRIYIRFEVTQSRTQQFQLRSSNDHGVSYRDLLRQQFNFSANSPIEEENYTTNLGAVTDLELMIDPDISHGPAWASLKAFRFGAG